MADRPRDRRTPSPKRPGATNDDGGKPAAPADGPSGSSSQIDELHRMLADYLQTPGPSDEARPRAQGPDARDDLRAGRSPTPPPAGARRRPTSPGPQTEPDAANPRPKRIPESDDDLRRQRKPESVDDLRPRARPPRSAPRVPRDPVAELPVEPLTEPAGGASRHRPPSGPSFDRVRSVTPTGGLADESDDDYRSTLDDQVEATYESDAYPTEAPVEPRPSTALVGPRVVESRQPYKWPEERAVVILGGPQSGDFGLRSFLGTDSGKVTSPGASEVEPSSGNTDPELRPPLAKVVVDVGEASGHGVDPRLVLLREPDSARAEAYRRLRDAYLAQGLPRVVAVTSALPGEGKTTAAANLAMALAEIPGAHVLLVDGNHNAPELATLLGIDASVLGFEPAEGSRVVRPFEIVEVSEGLDVACIPPVKDSAPAPFALRAFTAALETFRAYDYDRIIVDCASTQGAPVACRIADLTDGVLLVVRADISSRRAVIKSVQELRRSRIMGVILVDA